MGQPWMALEAIPPLPPPSPLPCPLGWGSWAVVSPGWPQQGGGRKAKHLHVLAEDSVPRLYGKRERDRGFLQMQPCAHPGGVGSRGLGALLDPRDMGITGGKLHARSIYWDIWAARKGCTGSQ